MSSGVGLVIFARDPKPGEVKGRLAADLGEERAAGLYRCFLEDTLRIASGLGGLRIFIAWAGSPASNVAWAEQLCPGAESFPQQGSDLGERMAAAAARARERGCDRVIVMGSDSPSLPRSRILWAGKALAGADIVLGPARDGGYYLAAGRGFPQALFTGVAWGTSNALQQTRANAAQLGLAVDFLPAWYDIDTLDDLLFLKSHLEALDARGIPVPCLATRDALRAAESPAGNPRIGVVVPALNEEASIGRALADIPAGLAAEVVVVDNGSTDGTPAVARAHGARVVVEEQRGYGAACLRGIVALEKPDIIVFLDGDYSDHPDEMERVVAPILEGRSDLVIGSRVRGMREPGALPAHSVFGSWLSGRMLRLFYRQSATDIGPFRAIRADALMELGMADRAFGWTMEMQAKAARARLRVVEVPVSYRRRMGKSKITGTVKGSVKAGIAIIGMALKTARWRPEQFS